MGIFKDRILKFIEHEGISVREFERKCGFSNGYFNKIKDFSARRVEEIAQVFPNLNSVWVLTGETDMLNSNIDQSVLQRIRIVINYYNLSDRKFAEAIGLPQTTISSLFKRGNEPNISIVRSILNVFEDIDINWLITGRGEMLKSYLPQAAINYEQKGAPYYNVDFNGGFDIVYNDQTQHPDYYIDYQPYNKDGVVWCNITGHSMEPLITHGDTIAMKEVESWQTFLLLDEIYGIVTDEFRTVKQVSKSERPDFLKLIPVNSNGYQPQDIPIKIIRKVFKVLGSVKKF